MANKVNAKQVNNGFTYGKKGWVERLSDFLFAPKTGTKREPGLKPEFRPKGRGK